MRKMFIAGTALALIVTLAACGGGKKSDGSSTSVPLPTGCPAQALMKISTPTGPVTVAAATRKAVVRGNGISIYLLSKLVQQPNEAFAKWIGTGFKVEGDGAIITEAKNADINAAPIVGTYVVSSKAPLQLTGYSVQRGGQVLTQSPTRPADDAKLEITSITETIVCGSISGPEGSATFIADRIDA
jgi:hypothetical protein